MKRRYNRKHKPLLLEPGELVLLSTKAHEVFVGARKLRLRFSGLYVVTQKIHDNAYALEGLPSSVPTTQNVEYLRRFLPTPPRFSSRPQETQTVLPEWFRDHYEWEIKSIIGHRPQ